MYIYILTTYAHVEKFFWLLQSSVKSIGSEFFTVKLSFICRILSLSYHYRRLNISGYNSESLLNLSIPPQQNLYNFQLAFLISRVFISLKSKTTHICHVNILNYQWMLLIFVLEHIFGVFLKWFIWLTGLSIHSQCDEWFRWGRK